MITHVHAEHVSRSYGMVGAMTCQMRHACSSLPCMGLLQLFNGFAGSVAALWPAVLHPPSTTAACCACAKLTARAAVSFSSSRQSAFPFSPNIDRLGSEFT